MTMMTIDQIVNYAPFGVTFRDLGFSVGDCKAIPKDEMGQWMEVCEQVMASRQIVRGLGRLILTHEKSPHRKGPHEHVIYVGHVVDRQLWVRGIPAHPTPTKPTDHLAPHSSHTTKGLLVYHLNRINPEGTQWGCRPYHGDTPLYLNLFAPTTALKIPLPDER